MKTKVFSLLAAALIAATGAQAQTGAITMTGTKTGNTYSYSGSFNMPTYDVEITTELYYKLSAEETLTDNQTAYNGKTDFFLDRTLTKDVWNTFASPFAITEDKMETYFGAGAKVRKLKESSVSDNVLTITFEDASSIEAGHPYIVKPTTANVDFSADGKEFAGVDLSAATATADNTTYMNFVPTLGKTTVTGEVDDILILNTSGTLVHPSATGNMKGFRGYFVMHEAPAGTRALNINFGDGEATGIIPIRLENGTATTDGMTFDLQGRKVAQPTQKGIYIQNGKKAIIK